VELFRRAYTAERRNGTYQLALAGALVGAGRRDEAHAVLDAALRDRPNDARATLIAARLAREEGRNREAASFYHRSIYGDWSGAEVKGHRVAARLELIEFLKRQGDKRQMLAELLPLEAETRDVKLMRQAADYLVDAGSPRRAADTYRQLLADDPNNVALLSGLGRAELAAGDYGPAQRAFVRAFRLAPDNAEVRHGLELTSALSSLDPTSRRLASREKYARSSRVLQLALDNSCAKETEAAREACKQLAAKRADMTNEAAERQLQLALQIWRSRTPQCRGPQGELVGLMMEKLGE
jgi:tetratricopeptide (TPR) repeat protein